MKINKPLTLILLFLGISQAWSQLGNNSGNYSTSWGKIDLMQKASKEIGSGIPSDLDESIYMTDEFVDGIIFFKDKQIEENYHFRYDMVTDFFEIDNNGTRDHLLKSPNISLLYNGMTFVYLQVKRKSEDLEFSYMTDMGKIGSYDVYVTHRKKVKLGKKSKTSMTPDIPSKLIDDRHVFIKNTNMKYPIEFPSSKKDLFNTYPNMKKDLKKFMKENKIDISSVKGQVETLKFISE